MAVIALYSVKGGVGKTTIAVDLAWRFAVHGQRETLLWDLDVQGGSAYLLGMDEPTVVRAASIFQRDGRPRQLIEPSPWPHLSLLPADTSLRQLPLQLARLGQRRRLATIAGFLGNDFERIVLDCPAGLNEVSEQALAAADLVIVPLPPSPLSARALETVRQEITRVQGRHPPILPIISMYDSRRRLHREVAQGIAAGWPIVAQSSPIEQCAVRRAPLGSFAGSSEAGRALDRLHRGIESKLAELAGRHSASRAKALA